MLPIEARVRISLWWPYVFGLCIWLAVAGAFFYLLRHSDPTDIPDGPVDLRALSSISNFCAAYIEANGGGQRLDALQGILSTGIFESGKRKIEFRTIKRRPDKSITTLKMKEYNLSFIVNGDHVWQRIEQQGIEPVDTLKEGPEADAMRELGHFFDPLMYAVLEQRKGIVSITPDTWQGEDCLLVELNLPFRGIKAQVFVDPLKMTPIARVENFDQEQIREIFYADYRSVNKGILEPFKIDTFLNGELQSRVLVDKCFANRGILTSIFEHPGPSREFKRLRGSKQDAADIERLEADE